MCQAPGREMVVFVCVWIRKVCGFDYFAGYARFDYWPHEAPINNNTLLSTHTTHTTYLCPPTPSVSLCQVNLQRKAIVQLFLEKRELLESLRVKREGTETK